MMYRIVETRKVRIIDSIPINIDEKEFKMLIIYINIITDKLVECLKSCSFTSVVYHKIDIENTENIQNVMNSLDYLSNSIKFVPGPNCPTCIVESIFKGFIKDNRYRNISILENEDMDRMAIEADTSDRYPHFNILMEVDMSEDSMDNSIIFKVFTRNLYKVFKNNN